MLNINIINRLFITEILDFVYGFKNRNMIQEQFNKWYIENYNKSGEKTYEYDLLRAVFIAGYEAAQKVNKIQDIVSDTSRFDDYGNIIEMSDKEIKESKDNCSLCKYRALSFNKQPCNSCSYRLSERQYYR